jgi:hypothetical protein
MPVTEELEELASMDLWKPVAFAVFGFMVPMLVKSALEGRTDIDLPDEAYGGFAIVGGVIALDDEAMVATAGGAAAYSADHATDRMGVQAFIRGD